MLATAYRHIAINAIIVAIGAYRSINAYIVSTPARHTAIPLLPLFYRINAINAKHVINATTGHILRTHTRSAYRIIHVNATRYPLADRLTPIRCLMWAYWHTAAR
jgi:hypothetical protein